MKKSNIKQIVGHNKELRGGLLTDIVPWRQGKRGRARQHRTQTYLDIINQFTGNSDTDIQLHLYITDEEKQSIISRYADVFSQPVIGLNPNSQASSRRWPPEYFALLIDALADQGQKTVLFGGLDDIDRVQSIGDMCAHKPYNFAGKLSLREFFAAVSLCSLLVTNESGPMHIAAGVGIPIIVFLGAADEKETGPITDAPVIMLNHHLHCSPCVRNRCKRLWKKNKCLTDITPKETAKAIIDIASKQ